jgi:hypothetical protein
MLSQDRKHVESTASSCTRLESELTVEMQAIVTVMEQFFLVLLVLQCFYLIGCVALLTAFQDSRVTLG